MKEIGKMLKEKREKLNLSLADAHKAIKIQEKYLKAIEEGDDTTIFFAEVYYKNFVRSYSKFLGFDPEEIINMINLKNKEKSLKDDSENIKRSNCKNQNDIKKLLIILGIVIAIILSVFILTFDRKILNVNSEIENFHNESYQELPQKQAENDTLEDSVKNANDEENVLDKHESTTILAEDKQQTTSSNKQEIEIIAEDTVWIRLDKDGKTIYEGNLNNGQRKAWKADKSFTLKVGYAPGLKVFFNGQEVDITKNAVQDVNTIILE